MRCLNGFVIDEWTVGWVDENESDCLIPVRFVERIWDAAYGLSGSVDSWSLNDLSEMWGAVWDEVCEEICD
jgi:hypothetical protein